MRADRLLTMLLMLQRRGKMTAEMLAQELAVSRRTVLRDVEALSLSGVPIYAEGGHGGGIALDEKYRTSLTGLQEAEVRSLFVTDNARLLGDVGLGAAAESSLHKLFAALPSLHQPSVDYIRQRIYIDPLWWWHETQALPFWEELQRAVYEDRCIEVQYEHRDGHLVERTLEPFSLVAKSSLWYVVARRDGHLRTYRVSRFHAVRVLERHFERPADFDLAHYWQEHVGEFAAGMAEYGFTLCVRASRLKFAQWLTPGRNAVLGEVEDGWLTVRFHLESKELAKMLVFGLGEQARVIEPEELREAVRTAAQAIVDAASI
ncbi:MAG: YafY family protein [Anaerolineae bacterium]